MKNYNSLTKSQQEKAKELFFTDYLKDCVMGVMEFRDKEIQDRVDKALKKADEMETPWFAHEYLLDDECVTTVIEEMALNMAKRALYSEPEELVVSIPE